MKRTLALFISLAITLSIPFRATASLEGPSVTPTSKNYNSLTLTDFINLSASDYGSLINKKISVWDKIFFELTKIKMKKIAKKEPSLLVSEYYSQGMNKQLGAGWWALIGVGVIAFLFLLIIAIGIAKINHTG